MRWTGHVTGLGEGRGVYRALMGKSEGKRPLGRPTRRWEDNIKADLQEVNVNVNCQCGSIKCGNFLSSSKPVSFSRRTLLHGVSKQVSK
jgi:hypothetical protein